MVIGGNPLAPTGLRNTDSAGTYIVQIVGMEEGDNA